MQKYKYTYQDWVDGNIETSRFQKVLLCNEMSEEDLDRIVNEKHKAFLHYLTTAFDALKRNFHAEYDDSLLKEEFLDYNISGYKFMLDTIRSEHEIIVTSALNPAYDGRFELTKLEVDTYLSVKVDDRQMEKFVFHFTADIDDAGIEFENEEKAPFKYILRSNFYNWLVWFKKQQELKNIEPSLKVDSAKLPKEVANLIGNHKSYTWLSNPDTELPELYQRLIEALLIHPDTKKEQFEAVFTAQPLNQIKPIEWISAKGLLAYFVDSIYSSKKIPTNTNVWSIAGKCFVGANSLAQSKTNYENTNKGTPKQSEVIDEILNAL